MVAKMAERLVALKADKMDVTRVEMMAAKKVASLVP